MNRLVPVVASTIFTLLLAAETLAAEGETAKRQPTTQLLPADTLAMVGVHNLPDLLTRLKETGFGRMLRDPQMSPFTESIGGSVLAEIDNWGQRLEVNSSSLFAALAGEVTLAIVPQDEQRPAVVAMLDIDPESPAVEKLLAQLGTYLEEQGTSAREESIGDTKLAVYGFPDDRELVLFRKDRTLVATSAKGAAQLLLARWSGEKKAGGAKDADATDAGIAANPRYVAVMNRSRPAGGETQLTFFAEPIALARGATFGNAQAQIGLALLPALGLDGVQAIGGTITVGAGALDQVTHIHLLLDNPPTGAVKMLALEAGETAPESWVPAGIESYSTWHWNLRQTFDTLATLVDSFQGEGALARLVERRVSAQFGIDFEKDVLDGLDGRFTYLTWYERPAALRGRGTLWAMKLKDPAAFATTLEKIASNDRFTMDKHEERGVTWYQVPGPEVAADSNPEGQPQQASPRPCFAVFEGYVLIADRASFLKQIILTGQGGGERLAEALDYKLVASKISGMSGSAKPVLHTFSRPDEAIRYLFELANNEEVRTMLAEGGERNGVASALSKAIADGSLPPFSAVEKYLAPGGSLITRDETGLHYINFTLRRK